MSNYRVLVVGRYSKSLLDDRGTDNLDSFVDFVRCVEAADAAGTGTSKSLSCLVQALRQ